MTVGRVGWQGVWAIGLALGAMPLGTARAETECVVRGITSPNASLCENGMGGEIPTPFDNVNLKVELADGESYSLLGRILILRFPSEGGEERPYFEVDLEDHPWLATSARKAMPLYPLLGSVDSYRQFDKKRVRFNGTAQSKVRLVEGNRVVHEVSLKPAVRRPRGIQ